MYWLARLEPVIRAEPVGEIVVVITNCCSIEGNTVYTGTSCVLGIDSREVKLYSYLGQGIEELLVVDTNNRPIANLIAKVAVIDVLSPATTIYCSISGSSVSIVYSTQMAEDKNSKGYINPKELIERLDKLESSHNFKLQEYQYPQIL